MRILLFPIVLFSLFFFSCKKKTEPNAAIPPNVTETESTFIELSPEQIAYAGIKTGVIQVKELAGTISCQGMVEAPPQQIHSLHSAFTAFVKEVRHIEGDFLQKGEVVAVLEHPDFSVKQTAFLSALVEITQGQFELARLEELAKDEASAQREVQKSRSDLQLARLRAEGLRSELQSMGFDTEKIESSQQIQRQIRLLAPVSGYLVSLHINSGKLIQPNELLAEMVDKSHLHVEMRVFARYLPLVQRGDAVQITIPGSAEQYPAEVHLPGQLVDQENQTALLHGHFKDERKAMRLAPGTRVQATIQTKPTKTSVLPKSAAAKMGDDWVFFVKKENGYVAVRLETGREIDGFIELLQVPEEFQNATFVTDGAYYLAGVE